jgi:hypothetical protein
MHYAIICEVALPQECFFFDDIPEKGGENNTLQVSSCFNLTT